MKEALTRIGIFYDGNFFNVVNNYYLTQHQRKAGISISGLHEFVRDRVAHEEHVDARLCQIVDVHYFCGRFTAERTSQAGRLFAERMFDDVLIREGVTTHYLQMGPAGTEKGIDVWFALEAYGLAIHKRFEVCVLVACDSDYVPLVRKLNSLGMRVMVLGWEFEYMDQTGCMRTTKTAQGLLSEVTYPVLVSAVIEDKTQKKAVKNLFLPQRESQIVLNTTDQQSPLQRFSGKIQNIIVRKTENKRFGYITPDTDGTVLWFGKQDLDGIEFETLSRGDAVTYTQAKNQKGELCAKQVRRAA